MTDSTQILTRILDCKGQYISVVIKSKVETNSTYKGVLLEKVTQSKFRAGIQFKNLQATKESLENGTRDEIKPLRWGRWKQYPYIIEHNGKEYIRLYPATNSDTGRETKYYANGKEIDRETFNSYVKPNNKTGYQAECYTVALENIIEIKE